MLYKHHYIPWCKVCSPSENLLGSFKVCSLPIATITNYQKFSGLEKHEFIIYHKFWRADIWNQGAERCVPCGGPRGESVPCLLQLPEATTFLSSRATHHPSLSLHGHLSCLSVTPLPPHVEVLGITLISPWITQHNLLVSGSLTQSHLQRLFCHIRSHIHVSGIRKWTSLQGLEAMHFFFTYRNPYPNMLKSHTESI